MSSNVPNWAAGDLITAAKLDYGVCGRVDSISDLKGINTTLFTTGKLANVTDIGLYLFDPTSSATGNDYFVVTPTVGSGRWLLQLPNTRWQTITGNTTAEFGANYVANSGSLITISLPTTCPVNVPFAVAGKGSGKWKVGQGTGQKIFLRDFTTTVGSTGYIAASNRYDSAVFLCITADTEWICISSSILEGN